jgi:tripartite-type tricarboxylate transporter receptor subunit TctC
MMVAVLLAAPGLALPQAYPVKPVRILVGFAAGGGVDIGARIVASGLADHWGTTVVVDNRSGAAGGIATETTAGATPDGYTLMLCQIGSHAITPARSRGRLPYDHIRDFAHVGMIGATPNVIAVHPSVPIRTVPELVAYARANPGKLNYGSSGVGASPHMSVELLRSMTGITLVHVPYRGAAAALADTMGGQMQMVTGNLPGGVLSAIRAGKIHALGITSAKRSVRVPEVPTIGEQGVPGYDVSSWYGICTQAAVPGPILARLNADLVTVLGKPDVRNRLLDQGIDVSPSTMAQFTAHIRAETAKWSKVVKDANLYAE